MCNQHKKALQPANPCKPRAGQFVGATPCERAIPLYPVRYGVTDKPFDSKLAPHLTTSGYPALKGGKAYGMRVMRPGSYLYLFYMKDGRMWTKHYQVTDDALFAPIWWTDKDQEQLAPGTLAKPHIAGATAYVLAPEEATATTVYLMASDAILTHCTLWKIENNIDHMRDKLAVKVKPAGGPEQAHTFHALLLGNVAPETMNPAFYGTQRYPWSEVQFKLKFDANAIAPALVTAMLPRRDITPLAVAVPDVAGIVSELNHLAHSAVQARAKYEAQNAHKLQSAKLVCGYFDQMKEYAANRPDIVSVVGRQRKLVDYPGASKFEATYKAGLDKFRAPIEVAVEDVTVWAKLAKPGGILDCALKQFDRTEIVNARAHEILVLACFGQLVHTDDGLKALGQQIDAPVKDSHIWLALAGGSSTLEQRLREKTLDIAKSAFDVADKYTDEHAATPATNGLITVLQAHAARVPEQKATIYVRRLRHIAEIRLNVTIVAHQITPRRLYQLCAELQGYQALGAAVLARWKLDPLGVPSLEVDVRQQVKIYEWVPVGETTIRSPSADVAVLATASTVSFEGNPLLRMWMRMRGVGGYLMTGLGGFIAMIGLRDSIKDATRNANVQTAAAVLGSVVLFAGSVVEIAASTWAYRALWHGKATEAIAIRVVGTKIGTVVLGTSGAIVMALLDASRAAQAANDMNSEQAWLYGGAAMAGAVAALATGAGGVAAASTMTAGATVAVLGLTPLGWAVVAAIFIGIGIALAVGVDYFTHGPIETWLKHSAWGTHRKHYTLPEELDAYHSLLHRPRLSIEWSDYSRGVGMLDISCTFPSSGRGSRFANSIKATLHGKPLSVVRGPIVYATGTNPIDYHQQVMITQTGHIGVGNVRWSITMHEGVIVDFEYLYQPDPLQLGDLGFTQPDAPKPLRITSGGWFSDPVDKDKLTTVEKPHE